tara:strand:+ start:1874 stop:2365 length:492 start_codon:yes stop_codon:yes gene_type:complete
MFPTFFGTVEMQGPSAPTGVSIATSASGDYDNACIIVGDSAGVIENGSNFNEARVTLLIAASGASDTQFIPQAYLRDGGGTAITYEWNLQMAGFNWTGLLDPDVQGTAVTTQSALTATGVGEFLSINSPPTAGDSVDLQLNAQAGNSAGNTSARSLTIGILYV